MNVRQQARALSLAKKPDGSFVLGDRARENCPGCQACVSQRVDSDTWALMDGGKGLPGDLCDGSGYLTRLLIEEKCPGCSGTGVGISRTNATCPDCEGSRVTYRWDEGLLRKLLKEAGWDTAYYSFAEEPGEKWIIFRFSTDTMSGRTLALAAMQALELEATS